MSDIFLAETYFDMGLTIDCKYERADMVQADKILHVINKTESDGSFALERHDLTGGHSLKLFKHRASLNIGRKSFSTRTFGT